MKKTVICLFIILSVLLSNTVLAYAESAEGHKPILDIIRDQGDYLPTDNVFNKENYDETMEGYDFSNDLMLTVYLSFAFGNADDGVDKLREYAKANIGTLHVVFRDEIITFQERKIGIISRKNVIKLPHVYDFSVDTPTYIQDIMNSTIYQSELHNSNTEYTRVVCFDVANSHYGAYIYYIGTDQTIVRVYKNHTAQAVDLLAEDFETYCVAYWTYIEANPGIGVGGGGVSGFIEKYTVEEVKEIYEQAKAKLEQKNKTDSGVENLPAGTETEGSGNQNTEPKSDKDGKANVLVWIIPAAAAVVLLGGALAFIIYRKKKT